MARRTPLAARVRREVRAEQRGQEREVGPAEEAARSSLIEFTRQTHHDYRVNWHHELIAEKLEGFARHEIPRLIITTPNRMGKSELASRRLPAWLLGRYPNRRILQGGHTDGAVKRFSSEVQEIITSPRYKEIFPGTRIKEAGQKFDRGKAPKRTDGEWHLWGRRGRYYAAGVSSTGHGIGANYIVIDDPHKTREKAYSQSERDKVWSWYTGDVYTRQNTPCAIVIIATRWHKDDLIGRLLRLADDNPKADQWEVLDLPFKAKKTVHRLDPRDPGEWLWPRKEKRENEYEPARGEEPPEGLPDGETAEVVDIADLRARAKRKYEAHFANDPEEASAILQCSPKVEGGNTFKTAWFGADQRWQSVPDRAGDWLQVWDLRGGGKSSASSYAVGQLWYRPYFRPGIAYLVDQKRGKWSPSETLDIVRDAYHDPVWGRATLKLVEAKADGIATLDMLEGEVPGLDGYKPRGRSKLDRWRAVTPYWRAGNILIPDPAEHPWVHKFIEEHTSVPTAENDDQVDASTIAVETLFITHPVRKERDTDIGLA